MSELADPRNWYAPEEGGYVFTDPVTQDVLNTEIIPSWLIQEPQLFAGMLELKLRGQSLVVNPIYHRHEHAGDLGDGDEFENLVTNADYHGMELFGYKRATERDNHTRLMRFMQASESEIATVEGTMELCERKGVDPLLFREFRALYLGKTPCFNADIASDQSDTERSLLEAFVQVGSDIASERLGMNIEEREVAMVALDNAREWVAASRIGDEIGLAEPDRRDLLVSVSFGMYHRDLSRKLGIMGSTVMDTIIKPELDLGFVDMPAMIRSGRVSSREARLLAIGGGFSRKP